MKVGRLIMPSGLVVNGRFTGDRNVIGRLERNHDGSYNVHSHDVPNECFRFMPKDDTKICEENLVKIAVDDLGVGFHLFDLKTVVDH